MGMPIPKKVIKFFDDNPKIQWAYGDYWVIDDKDKVIAKVKEIDFDEEIFLKGINYICQPTVFFRKEMWQKLGGLNENLQFALDGEYWQRAILKGDKPGHIKEYLAAARWHGQSKTINLNYFQQKEVNESTWLPLRCPGCPGKSPCPCRAGRIRPILPG